MRTYWLCQFFGWFVYSAVGILINLVAGGNLRTLLINHFFFIAYSIGLTHLFRREIRKRRRGHLAVSQMGPFLVTGVLIISVIQTFLVIAGSVIVTRGTGNPWTPTAVVALCWGMILATGGWTMLYIRFTEKRGYEARESQLPLALREAELRVLESQINPHFLFNCLNSIRALVEIDPAGAQDMLTRLANVLRYGLQQDREHTVLLASEVEAVADYLALEEVRFAERLRVKLVVDPSAAQCSVPPMLLHTLVENAIKHGIAQLTGKGDLIVKAGRENGLVRLVVENTGNLSRSTATSNQLGLANARERLRLLYGERANLSLKEGDGRVIAIALIPVD